MLTIDRRETLEDQKWTVYRDDVEATTFYIMPDQPRFRLDDDGKPFFQFIKYRDANGQGGGLCIFDVECAPRPEEMSRIRDQLAERHKQELAGRPVNLVLPQYLEGDTEMLLEQDGRLIERIVAQANLPADAERGERVLAFITNTPSLQKLAQILARNPSIDPDPRTAPQTVENGLALFLTGDNLRKGAALNAVQIAEALP